MKRMIFATAVIIFFMMVSDPVMADEFILYGPYIPISAGEYRLTVTAETRGIANGKEIAHVEAVYDQGMKKLGRQTIISDNQAVSSRETTFTFETLGAKDFECRIAWKGVGTLIIRRVTLSKIADFSDQEALGTALIKGATGFQKISERESAIRVGETISWTAADQAFVHSSGKRVGEILGNDDGSWLVSEAPVGEIDDQLNDYERRLLWLDDQLGTAKGSFSRALITFLASIVAAQIIILLYRLVRRRPILPRVLGGRLRGKKPGIEETGLPWYQGLKAVINIAGKWIKQSIWIALIAAAIALVVYNQRVDYHSILALVEKTLIYWTIIFILIRPLSPQVLIGAAIVTLLLSGLMISGDYGNSTIRLGNYGFYLLSISVLTVWRDQAFAQIGSVAKQRVSMFASANNMKEYVRGLPSRLSKLRRHIPTLSRNKPEWSESVSLIEDAQGSLGLRRIDRLYLRRRKFRRLATSWAIGVAMLLFMISASLALIF